MRHHSINYIEFGSSNIEETKRFCQTVFDWQFTDYGPDYTAFTTEEIEGGFYLNEAFVESDKGAPLVVFYSDSLESSLQCIVDAGGHITKDIFTFPGGRRFHFIIPSSAEVAVWSDR